MNYTLVTCADGINRIFEKSTNQYITVKSTFKNLRYLTNALNDGCGFEGYTPSFICNDANLKSWTMDSWK